MDVPVYSMSGEAAGTMSVDEIALGETVNADLLKQAFQVVSREMGGVPGLCSRGEFMEVWDRLGTL